MRVQQLIEDDLNRSAKYANKSTFVARGADTQLFTHNDGLAPTLVDI